MEKTIKNNNDDNMENIINKRIEFLYAAIKDAQELIRFTDTKTTILISIIGGYIFLIFTLLENIIKHSDKFHPSFWFIFYFLLVLILLCIWITSRIIFPTNNPVDNIKIEKKELNKLIFYISKNEYSNFIYPLINCKTFKLTETFTTYLETIKSSVEEDIISVLTLEFFKVSYIRNVKNDRFKCLTYLILITTFMFILFYITYLQYKN